MHSAYIALFCYDRYARGSVSRSNRLHAYTQHEIGRSRTYLYSNLCVSISEYILIYSLWHVMERLCRNE
jgi:hypothetical protein